MAMIQTWAGALDEAADRYPDKPAFLFEGAGWNAALGFVDWRDASVLVARGLSALGVGRGDRVAMLCPGSPVWPVLQVACSRVGAILVPVNVRYRLDEIAFVITKARPRVLFSVDWIRDVNYPQLVRDAVPDDGPLLVTLDALNPSLSVTATVPVEGRDQLTWEEFLAVAEQAEAVGDVGKPVDPVLLQFTSGTTSATAPSSVA